jgi:hypothetical protein
VAIGLRSGAGLFAWLAVVGILTLFALTLTWLAVIPGLTARSADAVSGFSFPRIFLPFVSSAFVPTAHVPVPVRSLVRRAAAGDIGRRHHPQLISRRPGRQRDLDRAGPVGRPAGRHVCGRHVALSRKFA